MPADEILGAVELKFDPGLAAGEFKGYASTYFGEPDNHGDIVAPGAFKDALDAGAVPKMLWQHDDDKPIGRWLSIADDDYGLAVHGKIDLATADGREAYNQLKSGKARGLSIGYRLPLVGRGRVHHPGGTATLFKVAVLKEISLCRNPSNQRAQIYEAKSLGSRVELEEILQRAGLARGAVKKLAAGGWPALSGEKAAALPDDLAGQLLAKMDLAALEMKAVSKRR